MHRSHKTDDLGVKFATDKGYVDFETRLETNSCYGGDLSVGEMNLPREDDPNYSQTFENVEGGLKVKTTWTRNSRQPIVELDGNEKVYKWLRDF